MRTLSLVIASTILMGAAPPAADDYPALVTIYKELRDLRELKAPEGSAGLPAATFDAREKKLAGLRSRLDAIPAGGWSRAQKIDYALVRARWNGLDFEHRVLRPWKRDPGFYLSRIVRIPYVALPLRADAVAGFRAQLQSVPGILQTAKANLTEGATELVKTALRDLAQSDGVENDQPLRKPQPAGILGWYDVLAREIGAHHPDLAADAARARDAVKGFDAWLKENQGRMTRPAGVGRENYDWYLRNVKLMPFDAVDCLRIGHRELYRSLAFLKFEENKNRNVPKLDPAPSDEDYKKRIGDADQHVRSFTREAGILTIPDGVGELATGVPWLMRPSGKRNFWEEVQYRDPRPDHVHAVIPGHRFDGWLAARDTRPIRGDYGDQGRVEGWGFYLEEMYLQAGLLDQRPKTRELFYIFQIGRAVRNEAEVRMHLNEWTIEQAVKYMVDNCPFMDPDVARVDAEIYLRRPGNGVGYQMGKIQIDQLVADRALVLGDKFNLKEFHDQFLATGRLPVSLIRWEMTGLDDEVKALGVVGKATSEN